MLKIRIIPCLDVKDGRVVKGVNFVDLIDAGDPVEAAAAYDAAGADELCFLDITASHENRDTIFDIVERTASRCFMPLTVGGGVRTIEDIRKLLHAGADKVSINTAAVHRRQFVAEGADKFGAQCIVVAIDAKRVSEAGRGAAMGDLHPWRPQPDRSRRRRLRPRGGGAGGGRDPAHLHGPRRHQGRLRHRADPRHRRCRQRAGDRLGRGRHARSPGRRGARRAMPAPCWPPRSSISAPTASARPSATWRPPACPCAWTALPKPSPIAWANCLGKRRGGAIRAHASAWQRWAFLTVDVYSSAAGWTRPCGQAAPSFALVLHGKSVCVEGGQSPSA